MNPAQSVLSVEQVKDLFRGSGTTVSEWARDHGFSRQVVYSLLSGRTRGYRGTAHAAAVALRLKLEKEITELEQPGDIHGGAADVPNSYEEPVMTS